MRLLPRPAHRARSRPRAAGLTLVEILVATSVLGFVMIGIFGGLLVSRRLTEAGILQNSAITVVQGYIEQIKNMEFADVPLSNGSLGTMVIPTLLDTNTPDPLVISPLPIPALASLPLNSIPQNVTRNVKRVDINQTPSQASDDLVLDLWVWVEDLSDPSIDATQVRGITIVYTYEVWNGQTVRRVRDSIRTIRSAVPTY